MAYCIRVVANKLHSGDLMQCHNLVHSALENLGISEVSNNWG